jgi:hypothetical protein
MVEMTPRLELPLLAAGQSQKEAFHNEALATIDCLLGGVVDSEVNAAPPASPVAARLYLVAAAATGAWVGQDGRLASFGEGGWRFVPPVAGLRLTEEGSGVEWRFDGAGWRVGVCEAEELRIGGVKVVGQRGQAIPSPAGGSVVDPQARTAIDAILSALRTHGMIET